MCARPWVPCPKTTKENQKGPEHQQTLSYWRSRCSWCPGTLMIRLQSLEGTRSNYEILTRRISLQMARIPCPTQAPCRLVGKANTSPTQLHYPARKELTQRQAARCSQTVCICAATACWKAACASNLGRSQVPRKWAI